MVGPSPSRRRAIPLIAGFVTVLGPILLGFAPMPWKLASVAFGAFPLLVMFGLRARERQAAGRIVSVELESEHTPRHELRVLAVGALGMWAVILGASMHAASGAAFGLRAGVGFLTVLVIAALLRPEAELRAGADGVLLPSGRFVAYETIERLLEELDYVVLVLKSGERIDVAFEPPGEREESDRMRAERALLVERVRGHLDARSRPKLRIAADRIDAAISDPAHAAERLRALADGAGYRVATLDLDTLEDLALADHEPVERRRGALYALSQHDPERALRVADSATQALVDEEARARLRRAGSGHFDP